MFLILRKLIDSCRGQRGQVMVMGVGVLIMSLGVMMISIDVGWWLRDKRDAQNDTDAIAHAAAQDLPDRLAAELSGDDWAAANGVDPFTDMGQPACTDGQLAGSLNADGFYRYCFIDQNSDGTDDMVRVKVSRPSISFIADALGVGSATLNPSAAAATVYVSGACVMPWGIVGENDDREDLFGLEEEALYVFQNQDEFVEGSPGNAGAISIYGQGADTYGDAIEGICDPENNSCTDGESMVFVDETLIGCRSKPGQMGNVTDTHLDNRFGGTAPSTGDAPCDAATFDEALNLVEDPNCAQRLVPVAVINAFPPSGSKTDLDIYGIVNFYLAGWSHPDTCFTFPDGSKRCGFVWGYLIKNAPVSTAEVVFTRDFIPFSPTGGALVE